MQIPFAFTVVILNFEDSLFIRKSLHDCVFARNSRVLVAVAIQVRRSKCIGSRSAPSSNGCWSWRGAVAGAGEHEQIVLTDEFYLDV